MTAKEGRSFGLTVGIAFLVLGGILLWREHETPAQIAGALGGLLVIAGLVIPTLLGPVYRGWMAFGLALSKVTTPIIMGVVYFGVILPTGVLRRAFGRNAVLRPRGTPSYWVPRGAHGKSDLKRQF